MGLSELSVVLKEGASHLMAGFLFFPENDALSQDSRGTQADLSQDLEGSGEQKGELALTKDVIQSEGEEDKVSRDPNAFEDEEDEADEDDEESETSNLAEDIQCPREEDTVHMLGSPGCMNCHYVLVRYPRWFKGARVSGRGATVKGEMRVDSIYWALFV